MISGLLQTVGRNLFVASIAFYYAAESAAQDLDRRPLADGDQLALYALLDDDIPGNCASAYLQLFDRGLAAKSTLISGLDSEDWQQRFLSAVLLAPLKPKEQLLEKVCRILIGHLPDNQIQGDALLASHALIAIGPHAYQYIKAASWHAEGQLAVQCNLLRRGITVNVWSQEDGARAIWALSNYAVSLRWLGSGKPTAPAMSVPLPTEAQLREQAFVDLASDHRRKNAGSAYSLFTPYCVRRSGEVPANDDLLLPFLENALLDSDRQRRLLAGSSLMCRHRRPSTALLTVAMESLKLDDFHGWARRGVPIANAQQAADFFGRYPEDGRPFLLDGLNDDSYAVRLRSATILARSRDWQSERYVPILLEHLHDNDWNNDANMAGHGLVLLGMEALPWLEQDPVDEQQAHYFSVIRDAIYRREQDPNANTLISNSGMLLWTDTDGNQ